jgi:RNA polymerase sigma-70 factor (ECF subfamily)
MQNDQAPDELIIRQVQNGSTELFRIIVERYENKIFSMGMRFFYNHEDSLDFTQEVFLKAYDRVHQYREIAPFKFWLVKLAYNLGINMKKKRGSDHDFDESLLEGRDPAPDKSHIDNEIKGVILREIGKLPERYRVCLDFYFFFGLKYSEISEITGYPVNTVKSDVLRAKNILRQSLKGTIAEKYDEM